MSDHEEEDVARAIRAVRAAYDDLPTLRASRHSKIPLSLSDADKALDKLCAKLNVLTDSPEALSIFREYTLKETSHSVQTSLSDAIVHDMEAVATYFRSMKLESPAETPGDLDEQKFRNIKEMVDQYKAIVSKMLRKHKMCVQDESSRCIYLADPS
jgi:hypothetical protein